MKLYVTCIKFVISDGSSLRLGSGLAQAQHLEGLLELGFCRLDPSIGRGQASGSILRSQARTQAWLGLSLEIGGSTHHYY